MPFTSTYEQTTLQIIHVCPWPRSLPAVVPLVTRGVLPYSTAGACTPARYSSTCSPVRFTSPRSGRGTQLYYKDTGNACANHLCTILPPCAIPMCAWCWPSPPYWASTYGPAMCGRPALWPVSSYSVNCLHPGRVGTRPQRACADITTFIWL